MLIQICTLEFTREQRVRALQNVQIVDSTIVAGLVERDGSIIGVRLSSDSNLVVNADFVVDASGRSSKIDTWLQELGYGPIASDEVCIASLKSV